MLGVMRMYVGITDKKWYRRLSAEQPDEVNFWKPGGKMGFHQLEPGELFLFKLHSPDNFIVGGGHFVKFSRLPASLAWLAFGKKNGAESLEELISGVARYLERDPGPDPTIGNIILAEPFWLPQDKWIPIPSDWPSGRKPGVPYDLQSASGRTLFEQVQNALGVTTPPMAVAEEIRRYARGEVNLRLGQGAFRVLVTDAYDRRCAITGEKTLPVLEASHIKPYSKQGEHVVPNGLLLRSDMHTLFDAGLISVTPDLRILVSPQIQDQYTNGKLYYSYQDEPLKALPVDSAQQPSKELLAWHNAEVFRSC